MVVFGTGVDKKTFLVSGRRLLVQAHDINDWQTHL